ncbi:hypothetical protein MMC22_009757 [Lobaria immixta]|nr:hypothetical protein [Lobaria immixta]
MGNYTRLAALIGNHEELALFRRFAALNAKSLLYMQAELVHLEAELENIANEDSYSGHGEKDSFEVSFSKLKDSCGTENDLQWRRVLEIRHKLKEYNNALLQYSGIQKYEKPNKRYLNILQEWLDRPEGGDYFLQGREAEIWESDADLIALSGRQAEKDLLTQLMSDRLVPWYHRYWGHRFKNGKDSNGVWHYEDATFLPAVNAISTVLSSLLPTTSILVLYVVQRPGARLAIIMAFTALFSLILTTVAKARRIDIFAATTA